MGIVHPRTASAVALRPNASQMPHIPENGIGRQCSRLPILSLFIVWRKSAGLPACLIGRCCSCFCSWFVLVPLFSCCALLLRLNQGHPPSVFVSTQYLRGYMHEYWTHLYAPFKLKRYIQSNPVDTTPTGNTPWVKGCEAVLGRRSSWSILDANAPLHHPPLPPCKY